MPTISVASTEEFDALFDEDENRLVVVDFGAIWCGPCKRLAPEFERLSCTATDVVFVKVDVDEAEDMASRYKISAVPTVLFCRGFEVIDKMSGADSALLKRKFENFLSIASEASEAASV